MINIFIFTVSANLIRSSSQAT